MSRFKPYTLLFEIGRKEIDGRGHNEYKKWLKNTLSIFEEIVIYHDGCLEKDDFPLSDLRFIPKKNLDIFKNLAKVKQVLENMKPEASDDITFKLPQYSLTQYAKFELGAKLLNDDNLDGVLWVDAGISRFISGKLDLKNLNKISNSLIQNKVDAVFEIDLRNNLKIFPIRILESSPGTSRRVISGTSFWLSKEYVNQLVPNINQRLENWIAEGVWDNEQVLLRQILPNQGAKIRFITQINSKTGGVARAFLRNRVSKYNLCSRLIKMILVKRQHDGLT